MFFVPESSFEHSSFAHLLGVSAVAVFAETRRLKGSSMAKAFGAPNIAQGS